MFPKLSLSLLTAVAVLAEETPRFMPENTGAAAHPIVAIIKIFGMIATSVFVFIMVKRSINVVKHDEDDKVDLPD